MAAYQAAMTLVQEAKSGDTTAFEMCLKLLAKRVSS